MADADTKSPKYKFDIVGTVLLTAAISLTAGGAGGAGIVAYEIFTQKPSVYGDMNRDNIAYKIVPHTILPDEVFLGVDVKGKRLYLPKEMFDQEKYQR